MLKQTAAAATLLVFALATELPVRAQGNTWDKVRYNGGTVATKVKPDDWDNRLTITSAEIKLELEDGQRLAIDPERVTGISYGQEAHRRVGTMIALGILVAPLALFGLFHKTKKHFIGIDYTTTDGKRAGMLLQGHKDNFRAILLVLSSVTGQPVAVSPKDRGEVPATVAINEVAPPTEKELKEIDEAAARASEQSKATNAEKESGTPGAPRNPTAAPPPPAEEQMPEPSAASVAPEAGSTVGVGPSSAPPSDSGTTAGPPPESAAAPPSTAPPAAVVPPTAAPPAAAAPQPATVKVDSGDVVADIYVDDAFVGNTPSQLKLAPGRHVVRVTAIGYAEWSRTIEATSGSEVSLRAVLEAAP